jgi:hypothetical protein
VICISMYTDDLKCPDGMVDAPAAGLTKANRGAVATRSARSIPIGPEGL